jgi:signal transduction histidine kinase
MLQDLTDELRHWSKLTAREARSPNAILAELRQRYQHRLNHAGIKLIWAVDPALPAIEPNDPASGQHLRALLSEALSNIIKHAQIRVTACVDGDVVVIELVDNGKGFTPGAVETGRGLPGMQRRAHILGAQLQIDSTPTRGSCWKLSLPVC